MATKPFPQPKAPDQMLGMAAGFQQIGDKFFVVINVGSSAIATTLVVEIDVAKQLAKIVKEAAETAEVQIVKPPSLLHQA
jgi:hypothetical protein